MNESALKIDKKLLKIICAVFAATELVLLFLIQFDVFGLGRVLSFSSVCICLGFAFLFSYFLRRPSFILAAMIFTLIADIFFVLTKDIILVWNGTTLLLALFAFATTQIFYFIVTLQLAKTRKEKLINIITRAIVITVLELLTAYFTKSNYSFTVFVGVFYFANLIGNAIFATVHIKTHALFAVAMLLFFCCDLVIAFDLANLYANLSAPWTLAILNSPVNFIWLFYIPSQTLFALSILYNSFKELFAKNSAVQDEKC